MQRVISRNCLRLPTSKRFRLTAGSPPFFAMSRPQVNLAFLQLCSPAIMNDISVTILPEAEDDAQAIEQLHERTFGPGRYAKSAYRLRERIAHCIELSFTARIGTLLVGSLRLSPIEIGQTKALLLGPLTVEPPFRDRGIGAALI